MIEDPGTLQVIISLSPLFSFLTVFTAISWKRRLCDKFKDHSEFQVLFLFFFLFSSPFSFKVAMRDGVRLIGLGYRMKKYIDSETSAGRLPIMNPFYKSPAGTASMSY